MDQQIDGEASKDDGDGMPFDALACVVETHAHAPHEMHAHAPHAARYDSYTHHDRYTHTCGAHTLAVHTHLRRL